MISVLYVDDETTLLEIGKFFLEKDGLLRVDTCSSVKDALIKIGDNGYDIIISDYALPEMNGIEFLKCLRYRGDTTPFIIFTGRGREAVVIEALNLGTDFYLEKAGNAKAQFAELIHEIKQVIERKSLIKRSEQSDFILKCSLGFINEGILVANGEGRITSWNQKFLSLVKIPNEQICSGNSERTILKNIQDQLENSDDFSQKIDHATSNHKSSQGGNLHFKDGRLFNWFSRTQVIGDAVIGRFWIFQDTTELNRFEFQLMRNKEQSSHLMREREQLSKELEKDEEIIQKSDDIMDFFTRSTSDGVFTSVDGKIGETNEQFAEMLGYCPSELAGRSIVDFVALNSYTEIMNYMSLESETGSSYLALRKDGSTVPVAASGHLINYRGNSTLVTIVHEVSGKNARLQQEKFSQGIAVSCKSEKESAETYVPVPELKTVIKPETILFLEGQSFGKESDPNRFRERILDKQTIAKPGEFKISEIPDAISLTWEIDAILEPEKIPMSRNGISENNLPQPGKKRCPNCGSIPFEPDGDWCDECGSHMSGYKIDLNDHSEFAGDIQGFEKNNLSYKKSPSDRKIILPSYVKKGIGLFLLLIFIALILEFVLSDFQIL